MRGLSDLSVGDWDGARIAALALTVERTALDSVPRLDLKGRELYAVKGLPPNLAHIPPGCAFHPRCPSARDVCRTDAPPLYEVSPTRGSACHFWRECLNG